MKDFFARILNYDYFFSIPVEQDYLKLIFAFYTALIIFTFAYVIFYRIKHGRNKILKKFRKLFFWGNLSLGLVGLFLVLSRHQSLPLFSLRFANYLLLFMILGYNTYLVIHYKRNVKKKLFLKKEKDRLEKWLPGKNKKAALRKLVG